MLKNFLLCGASNFVCCDRILERTEGIQHMCFNFWILRVRTSFGLGGVSPLLRGVYGVYLQSRFLKALELFSSWMNENWKWKYQIRSVVCRFSSLLAVVIMNHEGSEFEGTCHTSLTYSSCKNTLRLDLISRDWWPTSHCQYQEWFEGSWCACYCR